MSLFPKPWYSKTTPPPNKRLTPEMVAAIRAAYQAGATQQALADQYGMARSYVGLIVTNQRWQDPTLPTPLRPRYWRKQPGIYPWEILDPILREMPTPRPKAMMRILADEWGVPAPILRNRIMRLRRHAQIPPNPRRFWSVTEDDALALWFWTVPIPIIAQRLHRSVNATVTRLVWLGVPTDVPPLPEAP